MSANGFNVLLIGKPLTADTQAVANAIRGDTRWHTEEATTIVPAARRVHAPDLVVVVQDQPDQYSRAEVLQLIAAFPESRLLCCCGSWCESGGRNRQTWPLAVRVAARDAARRIETEFRVIQGRRQSLPLTGSRDEIFEFDHAAVDTTVADGLSVFVDSPDRAFRDLVADLCQVAGWDTISGTETSGADAVVFDADPMNERTLRRLSRLRDRVGAAPIVAIMTMPHRECTADCTQAGATRVVSRLSAVQRIATDLHDLVVT